MKSLLAHWIRVGWICLVALGAWHPATAAAVPPTDLSASVEYLDSGQGGTAIYSVHATAGVDGAVFGLDYELPEWPTAQHVQGSPISIQEVRLNGVGGIRRARTPVPKPKLKIQLGCRRALQDSIFNQYWIEIPSNGSVVVELEASGTFPRWPNTDYSVELSTFSSEELLEPKVPLATLTTSALAPKGVHIQMHAVSESGSDVGGGRSPKVIGTTDPKLPLTRLALRLVRPTTTGGVFLRQWGNRSSIALPAVETDRAGRFQIPSMKLGGEGRFAFLARVQERPGKTAADWNCGPFFSLP
jgi:hypothetical protein